MGINNLRTACDCDGDFVRPVGQTAVYFYTAAYGHADLMPVSKGTET